ncbi:hypothetical protein SADUNF_Sadunf16G0284700 [Salix dunnii]|uniref:Aminotransferase-like plant mobile domain-containing protein n=1 Tax=Salix dunnii TaxID=1413687 RepID=A0A835JDU9_9ROSI|nr:hypothetical protein SADUNF_Sadunf16G0284700 [Salix dunnii]
MRPYADNLDNWHLSSYYREEDEQVVFDGSSSDGELHSFVICLHGSELVGLDCKDSYLPHRGSGSAMQFGMDQDLPGASENILKQEKSLEKTDPSPSVHTIRQKNSYLSSAQNLKNCRKLTQLASKSPSSFLKKNMFQFYLPLSSCFSSYPFVFFIAFHVFGFVKGVLSFIRALFSFQLSYDILSVSGLASYFFLGRWLFLVSAVRVRPFLINKRYIYKEIPLRKDDSLELYPVAINILCRDLLQRIPLPIYYVRACCGRESVAFTHHSYFFFTPSNGSRHPPPQVVALLSLNTNRERKSIFQMKT